MATFGQTGDQAGSSASSADKTSVSQASPSESGTVYAGRMRLWMTSGSTTARMVIYSYSSGAPGTKLASSDPLTVSNTTEQEIEFTFSGADMIGVTAGVEYFIGVTWQDPGTPSINISRDSTAGGRQENSSYNVSPFGSPTVLTGPIDAYILFTPVSADADDGGFFEFF